MRVEVVRYEVLNTWMATAYSDYGPVRTVFNTDKDKAEAQARAEIEQIDRGLMDTSTDVKL